MGSKTVNLKRKRETDVSDSSKDFFSAKFLTSPELLDYEVCEIYFLMSRLPLISRYLTSDRRYQLPSTNPIPTSYFTSTPSSFHTCRESEMGASAKPIVADGVYAKRRGSQMGQRNVDKSHG